MTKEEFYANLELEGFTLEEINDMLDIVNNIEDNNLTKKQAYALLKTQKPRDVNAILSLAYYEEKNKAFDMIYSLESSLMRNAIRTFRKALCENTVEDFVKNYKSRDFVFLEFIIQEDSITDLDDKYLYISELKYLDGELDCAIPEVKNRKLTLPNLDGK